MGNRARQEMTRVDGSRRLVSLFDDDEPTGVMGTLKQMPLEEIVQSLVQNRRDAMVEIRLKPGEAAVVGFEAGAVTFARSGAHVGEEAFYALLRGRRGSFRIRYGRKPLTRNVTHDTMFLLLEGMRRMDERNNANEAHAEVRVISAEARPTSSPVPEAAHAPASHSSGKFARFFDEAGVVSRSGDEF